MFKKTIYLEAFYQAFKNFKEEMARRARLMQDETSEEGQRYVAEMIQRQNIEFMVCTELFQKILFHPIYPLSINLQWNICPKHLFRSRCSIFA